MMKNTDFFLKEHKPHATRLVFFKLSFEIFIKKYQKRLFELAEIWDKPSPKCIPLSCNLTFLEKLNTLKPRQLIYPNKYLLSETQSEWCLYMENLNHGTDLSGQPHYLAEQWKVETVYMYLEPSYGKEEYGSVMFAWENGLNPISEYELEHRIIQVIKETGRADFYQSGIPFTFENTANYEKRLKKDRLTVEMVEEYCRHFGIHLFDLDFYKGRSVIFSTE